MRLFALTSSKGHSDEHYRFCDKNNPDNLRVLRRRLLAGSGDPRQPHHRRASGFDGPANQGALCVKGQFAYDYVHHPDRLAHPLVRDGDGRLQPATWDEALQRAAQGFLDVLQEHGRHAVYGVASGRTPSEANYIMQKFIRVGFGTNYIDNCSRA